LQGSESLLRRVHGDSAIAGSVIPRQHDPSPDKRFQGHLEAPKGVIRDGDIVEAVARDKHSINAPMLGKQRNLPQGVDPCSAQCTRNFGRELPEGLSDLKICGVEEANCHDATLTAHSLTNDHLGDASA
jgi:hypothetical protein